MLHLGRRPEHEGGRRRPFASDQRRRRGGSLGGGGHGGARSGSADAPKSSAYKGVSWHKHSQKWYAYIQAAGKMRGLGYFDTQEEAARATTPRRARCAAAWLAACPRAMHASSFPVGHCSTEWPCVTLCCWKIESASCSACMAARTQASTTVKSLLCNQ